MDRINIDGDYLIIAPRPDVGNYQTLTERAYLVDNLINFIKNNDVEPHQITVYELKQVNIVKELTDKPNGNNMVDWRLNKLKDHPYKRRNGFESDICVCGQPKSAHSV